MNIVLKIVFAFIIEGIIEFSAYFEKQETTPDHPPRC